jgi:hypothetical protein
MQEKAGGAPLGARPSSTARVNSVPPDRLAFFLGGRDLEMLTIAQLLRDCGVSAERVHDDRPDWGAPASRYRERIGSAIEAGLVPVLVELPDDLALGGRAIHVDHHGPEAGATSPTSLEQVFDLLRLPRSQWTRRHSLVAANDRGWIPELRAMGASAEEIRGIREAERRAQGISDAEERSAAEALESAETHAGGRLVVVRLPHRRTAPAMDRLELAPLELTGDPPRNVLVLSYEPGRPGLTEANFSGEGWLVAALAERFPGGWLGGALPERGFWGHAEPVPEGVVEAIAGAIESRSNS